MKNEIRDMLPVSGVAQIVHCPRNFYYRYVAGMDDRNAAMLEGIAEDDARRERSSVYRPDRVQRRNVKVASETLGLVGEVDAVEESDGVPVPVEYKSGAGPAHEADRVQLCAYAMILEDMHAVRIPRGYVYHTGRGVREPVEFTGELRGTVMAAIETAWDILEGSEIPPPLDDARCTGCSLADVCMPDQVTLVCEGVDRTPSRVAPRSTFERTVFVDESWGSLGRSGDRMTLKKGSELVFELPFESFDQVFLVGQLNLSGALLQEFFRRNTFVAFFSAFGRFEGTLAPEKSKYSALRQAQITASADPERRMLVAREIVDAKLANMRVLLMRAKGRQQSEDLAQHIKLIAALRREIPGSADEAVLMGIEGAGTRAYFQGFQTLFDPALKFDRRTRRPPRDPVNAVLSFGYSILAGQITGIIQAVGLDPYFGFLHRQRYGKPCLALDLMEVFRPVIADSVALRMFSTGMVAAGDFAHEAGAGVACRLAEKGREAFFREFARRMKDTATHPVFGLTLPYRRLVEMEVRFLAKYLVGEVERFQAYRVR